MGGAVKAAERERSEAARELCRRIGLEPRPDPLPNDETVVATAAEALMADRGLRDLLVFGVSSSTPDP